MSVTLHETGAPAAAPPVVVASAPAPAPVETPVQSVVNAAAKVLKAVDGRGRAFTIRRPSSLERMRILRAIGGELAANEPYLGYCMLAASVRELDGERLAIPATSKEFEALIDRLGDEGIEAVAKAFKAAQDEAEAAETDTLAAAKN